jgi:hypothetical protein
LSDSSNADDNSNLVDMDDLDSFEDAFYNRKPVATDDREEGAPKEDEEVLENEDDALATDQEDSKEDGEDEDEAPAEPEKPKKKSAQDRINELTAKAREAERREADLRREFEELKKARNEVKTEDTAPKPLRETLSANAPSPDATDKDGEPVYPLGEFDPKYIRDLTRFTIAEETKAAREEAAKVERERMVEAAQEELTSSWLQKLDEAEKELPDIREEIASLEVAFANVDPAYGEFLAGTIMSCDNGPQMMYYLSQNIGEAQKIVASGPAAATLALGRLDAKFSKVNSEEKRNTKKVSDAPKPPEARSRGSAGRFATAPDTDDLDAFEREFFKKK